MNILKKISGLDDFNAKWDAEDERILQAAANNPNLEAFERAGAHPLLINKLPTTCGNITGVAIEGGVISYEDAKRLGNLLLEIVENNNK